MDLSKRQAALERLVTAGERLAEARIACTEATRFLHGSVYDDLLTATTSGVEVLRMQIASVETLVTPAERR